MTSKVRTVVAEGTNVLLTIRLCSKARCHDENSTALLLPIYRPLRGHSSRQEVQPLWHLKD